MARDFPTAGHSPRHLPSRQIVVAAPPQQTLRFQQPNQQHRPPDAATHPSQPAPTGGSPQQRPYSRSPSATVHSAIAFSSNDRSTHQRGPVQQRLHRHCRLFPRTTGSKQNHEAPLRAPSPTAAATVHRSEGSKKTEAGKIINLATSAPRQHTCHLPQHKSLPRH